MSYCVNCGVELDDSAKECALCHTPVIHPNRLQSGFPESAFPEKVVIPQSNIIRYRAIVATLIMALPLLVCIPINYFVTPDTNWSVYVASTMVLLWIFFVSPFFWKKSTPHTPYISLTLDGVFAAAYIYIMYHYNSQGTWFFRIAVPMVVCFVLLGYVQIFYLQKKKTVSRIRKVSFSLMLVALYSAFVDFVFLFTLPDNLVVACVTLTVFFTSAVLAVFLRFASENKQFRAWVSRKFFV